MGSLSEGARRKLYVPINCTNFRADCVKAHAKLNTDKALSYLLMEHGVCDSVFSNTYRNYLSTKNKDWIDKHYVTEDIERPGYMQESVYNNILEVLKMRDTYRLVKRSDNAKSSNQVVTAPTVDNSNIAEQLKNIEMSINRLGNVMMQILEKMPKQTVSNTIHMPADKPIAVVKK